jgi:uncharacterized repeat protein (TIGR03803 family)
MPRNWTLIARLSSTVAHVSRNAKVLVIAVFLTVFATQSLQAQNLSVLYTFSGYPDGAGPATPIRDRHGNLYTTTYTGGAYDFGAVVKIGWQGNEEVLHDFTGGSDGSTPASSLIMDANGNLFGTTYSGGSQHCFQGYGCGVVYELSPGKNGWTETILYRFKGGTDGAHPGPGALAFDAEGNLYGTTQNGGGGKCSTNCGVVYRISPTRWAWKEQVLHAFGVTSQTDGANPYAGVIVDPAGYVYGTTYHGGNFGFGTVFKIDPSGAETVLYSFTGGADGGGPQAALVSDADANRYGPTSYGGDLSCAAQYPIGCGTIFKVDTSGKETVVHTFIGYPTDGNGPVSTLVRDKAGNLYGTARGGNSTACLYSNNEPSGCGVVFRVKTNGREAILHNFSFGPDGTQPQGVNLVGRTLYGATLEGGPGGGTGTVFKLTGW